MERLTWPLHWWNWCCRRNVQYTEFIRLYQFSVCINWGTENITNKCPWGKYKCFYLRIYGLHPPAALNWCIAAGKCMITGQRCRIWLPGERATNEAETYLILKMQHLLTDLQVRLRALEMIIKNFLFLFFWRGYSSFVKPIYFYRNPWVTKLLFLCNYSGIKNEMLQLFTCEILHLFLLIKNLPSYCSVFYCGWCLGLWIVLRMSW